MHFAYIPLLIAKMLQLEPVESFCTNHFLFFPKEGVTFMKIINFLLKFGREGKSPKADV